jgi:hypothetical protein
MIDPRADVQIKKMFNAKEPDLPELRKTGIYQHILFNIYLNDLSKQIGLHKLLDTLTGALVKLAWVINPNLHSKCGTEFQTSLGYDGRYCPKCKIKIK